MSNGAMTTPSLFTQDYIEKAVRQGEALKSWWWNEGARHVTHVPLLAANHRADQTWGFFADVPVLDETVPVMGVVQDFFFDRPRVAGQDPQAVIRMEEQVRAFALKYMLRTDAWSPNEFSPAINPLRLQPPDWLKPLSLLSPLGPGGNWEVEGIGHTQLCYKLKGAQKMKAFSSEEQKRIVFPEALKQTYDWVLIHGKLYSMNLSLELGKPGHMRPNILIPLGQQAYTVMSQDLMADTPGPEEGVTASVPSRQKAIKATLGPGFAFVATAASGPIAFSPSTVQPGIMLQYFTVDEQGEVRAWVLTIFNRPQKLLNISLNPLELTSQLIDLLNLGLADELIQPLRTIAAGLPKMGIDPVSMSLNAANTLTGNFVGERLGLSMNVLEKLILVQHAVSMDNIVLGMRHIWDEVPDWTAPEADLPAWVVAGDVD